MNHLQRKIVEQVNAQGMECKGGHHREKERKHKEAVGSSQELKRKKESKGKHVEVMGRSTER